VAHIGRERWEPRLDIGAGAVPAQQCVKREREAQVVDPRQMSGGRADARGLEEVPYQHAQPVARVGGETAAAAVEQERCVCPAGEARATAVLEVASDLARGVFREGNHARLVELGVADEQDVLDRIVVAERQTPDLAAAKTRRVEQDECESRDLSVERRDAPAAQRASRPQEPGDLVLGEDVGPASWLRRRELARVGNEAARLTPAPIETELTDHLHAHASSAGHQVHDRRAPRGEGLLG